MSTETPDAEPTVVPAHICVVVREGVPNVLHSFDLRVTHSEPAAEGLPGKTTHTVHLSDIVWGLAVALREQAAKVIEGIPEGERAEARENVRELIRWVDGGVA